MNKEKQNKIDVRVIGRIIKLLFRLYPARCAAACALTVFSSVVSSIPAIFNQKILAVADDYLKRGDTGWSSASEKIIPHIIVLILLYLMSITAIVVYRQLMVMIAQGFLNNVRKTMFNNMQKAPINFFDTHKHGEIMSYFTNDTDTMRELVAETIPAVLSSSVIVLTVFGVMIWYSLWMTAVVVLGTVIMILVSKKIGGKSAGYFVKVQESYGRAEGYIQEAMNGTKVVKVFNHERKSIEEFDVFNDELYESAAGANAYANMLGPIIMNIGNVLYVVGATVGGLFLLTGLPNFSLYGLITAGSITGVAFTIDIVVPFLNMMKQFTGNVNQIAQQVNSIAIAMAGAKRVFAMMDIEPEADGGYVTLVNAVTDDKGNITETDERTGKWAWKHPHRADGTVTYTELRGDVRLENVDFSYVEGKPVLKNISVYAEPGQKVAFVGATGAGKTTITNLINRFYDIEDGKIRYDGININKIRKSDLRRSLGIVLQDTNLFTGTVLDNIRYGRLDATDEECIEAAKLVGAHDFISRMPQGYMSTLSGNGANLSQGQRQLISIARAAVADPPVMILDEATSSIDTRTEAIVQKGMDRLMEGRTVFVIAHRLSTVMNSDVIMVLDHGEIIERGSHEKLLSEKGTYYQLYTGAFELE